MHPGSRAISTENVHRLVLANESQWESYLAQANQRLGLQLPVEYLRQGEALSIVDQNELVCGSIIVITESPFRSLASIPSDVAKKALANLDSSRVAEINGLWLSDAMKSPFLSFTFWRLVVRHLLESKKDKFIFTYENSNSRMKALAYWLDPEVLYSGSTIQLPGMKSAGDETIAIVDAKSLRVFLAMLERRGVGSANRDEQTIVDRLEQRTRRQAV